MAEIQSTLRLWVASRGQRVFLLAPSDGGLPEPVVSEKPILRTCYLNPDSAEQELESGIVGLDETNSGLLIRTGDSDAPPSVSALLFSPEGGKCEIDAVLDGHPKRVTAQLYLVATAAGPWRWNSDLAQGKFGYFVTGMRNQRTVWRIRRAETDFANRVVFTIQPLTFSNGLPSIDIRLVKDEAIRQEVDQHWQEFTEVYSRGLPYRTVSAAKDICECILLDTLVATGHLQIGNRNFAELLRKLQSVIESERQSTKTIPFTDLHYHQMSKLRILHGHTHVGRAATSGRLQAELALSVTQDLVEVLRAAGLA